MRICWLLPSDKSGGIAPVSLSFCNQAAKAGHQTTMLLLASPSWIASDDFQISSLGLSAGVLETPILLAQWLEKNPQDILFFNGCDEFDVVIPYLSPATKCVYVVHDTAPPYWSKAIEQEDNLEAIVAVSETVASKFRHRLKYPDKLAVIYNGCVFPELPSQNEVRQDDLIFLGGENPTKGAFDALSLWKSLAKESFKGNLHWFGNLKPNFIKRVKRLPNSGQIQIHGLVSRDKIFSTAFSSKVLLMLSRVEPFGMATIEAMGMGCVPVAWDVETGTKEIARANKTGLFAPLGETHTLAKQVVYACQNYQVFNHAVISHARQNFDETMMWKGYQSLINHISLLSPIIRDKHNEDPERFQPRVHRFQFLPSGIRSILREMVGKSPTLGYWLRDMRGW